MSPSDQLPPSVFIASSGKWHITTATYCGGGADTKCGLRHVCGFVVAVNPMLAPMASYRRAASEHGRIGNAGAPDCEVCFRA